MGLVRIIYLLTYNETYPYDTKTKWVQTTNIRNRSISIRRAKLKTKLRKKYRVPTSIKNQAPKVKKFSRGSRLQTPSYLQTPSI